MAEAYPIELRERVVEAYESGEGSYEKTGQRFSVSICSVRRWVRLKRREGHLLPRAKGGGTHSPIKAEDIETILECLGDATANEITFECNRGRKRTERVHVSSIKRALHRYGYVVKKNAFDRWSRVSRTCKQNV